MKKTSYSKEFEAKVSIEALRGEKTVQELSQIHGVHPYLPLRSGRQANLIGQWKKQLPGNAASTFDKNKKDIEKIQTDKKIESLYNQIGMLQVEKEFLKKKYRQLYGTEPEL